MNKLKKLQVKLISSYLVIGLMAVLGIGVCIYAYTGSAPNVVVEGDYIEAPKPAIIEEEVEKEFGGATNWKVEGNIVTYTLGGTINDASTTLFSVVNPFGSPTSTDDRWNSANPGVVGTNATSTVDLVRLDITGIATSSMQITCGAAADAYSFPTYHLFNLTYPSTTTGVFENNTATTTAGFNAIGAGSIAKIYLTHDYSYLNCYATGTDAAYWGGSTSKAESSLLGPTNTFDAEYSVRISKTLRY